MMQPSRVGRYQSLQVQPVKEPTPGESASIQACHSC